MSISVTWVWGCAHVIGKLGVDPNEFLRAVGVDDGTSVDEFVSNARIERVLMQLGRRLGDAAFGLTLATATTTGSFGNFDWSIWSTSRTLGDALQRMARLYPFLSRGVALTLDEKDGVARFSVEAKPDGPYAFVLTDLALAAIYLRAREAVGHLKLRGVSLRHPEVQPRRYEELFGVAAAFGQPTDHLAFDAKLLAAPFPTADPRAAALFDAHALELMSRPGPADPLLDRLKSAVARRLPLRDLELAGLAEELGQSRRTLQRDLHERGTSLKDVIHAVRRELAMKLLADERRSTVVIAHDLGFANPQAFYRAFSRWTGMSTAMYRERNKQGRTDP
jgi:AraC-like DNA-binding protein